MVVQKLIILSLMLFITWGAVINLQDSDEDGMSELSDFHDGEWRDAESACDPVPNRVYQLINRKNEFPLGLDISSKDDKPALFRTWEDGEIKNTLFQFIPTEENPNVFFIYHKQNDKFLDIQHHSNAKGALLTQKGKTGEPCQKFYLTPSQDSSWCAIGNLGSGRYLAPIKVSSSVLVAQQDTTPMEDEYWRLEQFIE